MKYITVKVGKIINRIAKEVPGIPGYTEGVLEPFFPSDSDLDKMTKEEEAAWVRANNKRMSAICKFLNERDL